MTLLNLVYKIHHLEDRKLLILEVAKNYNKMNQIRLFIKKVLQFLDKMLK